MDITRRMINLSWVSLLHGVECGLGDILSLKADFAAVLDERQQKVLTLRWGLETGMPQTLDVVGPQLGVTRERIRQIEAKAIRILKAEKERKENDGTAND